MGTYSNSKEKKKEKEELYRFSWKTELVNQASK